MNPAILRRVSARVDENSLPSNDLEAIRVLLSMALEQDGAKIVYTVDRLLVAQFLRELHQALVHSARASAALYVYLLFRNYCRRARIQAPQ